MGIQLLFVKDKAQHDNALHLNGAVPNAGRKGKVDSVAIASSAVVLDTLPD